MNIIFSFFFFSSRRRHTRCLSDWSSDVCSSDLHPQIAELADLAAAFPDTKIVLNHVGGPLGSGAYRSKHSEVFPRWAASIKALAAHQNVYVKVGGLGQIINGLGFNERAEPPSSEMLATALR